MRNYHIMMQHYLLIQFFFIYLRNTIFKDYDRENPVTKHKAMVKWLKKRKMFDFKNNIK